MRYVRTAVVLALFVFSAIWADSGWAQVANEGSIRGYVKDEQAAIMPGVTVTATSPDAPGTHVAVSDGKGLYRLLNLPPGEYTLTAELQGFAKWVRAHVVIRAGLNIAVDIVMTVGGLNETVEVKAETPLLESKTPVQAVNIDGDFQRALPLSSRRTWSDFLFLTPGVSSTEYKGQDFYFFVRGSDYASHVVQVDGADMTSPEEASTMYINLGGEAVGDVQIKTGAVDAASPLGVGAVINIVSKSGTNQFSAGGSTAVQRKRWSASNVTSGTTSALNVFQQDLRVGGPIVRDHAWFFASYRYAKTETGISRTAQQIANVTGLVPGYVPFDNEGTAHFVFVRGTAQLGRDHQVSTFYQRDANPFTSGPVLNAGLFSEAVWGGNAASVRLSSIWGASLATRVTASYNNKRSSTRAYRGDVPQRTIHQSAYPQAGRLQGSGAIAYLDNNQQLELGGPSEKFALSADATVYRSGWLGSHEFQVGTYLAPIWRVVSGTTWVNGGTTLQEEVLRTPSNPAAGTIPFHRLVYDAASYDDTRVYTYDYAVYVQDSWRPSNRVTLTPGVRIDWITRKDKLFDVTTQKATAVGPRVGLNYQITADGHNSIRASWGRVHEAVSTGAAITAGSVVPGFTDLYDLNMDGTFETSFYTPPITAANASQVVDLDGFHQPHIDEWIVGYRRQLPARTSLDVSVVRRQYRDRLALVEINGIIENGVFKGYRDPSVDQVSRMTSNTWNWPVYTGYELQLSRQTERMRLLASYTRAFQHIAGTWQPNDPASFIQPDAFANDAGIGATRGGPTDANSLGGNSMTSNSAWRDHDVHLAVSYAAPWKLMLALNYTYQSGSRSGPVLTRLAAADPRFGAPTVRLSTGRVVSNPLATKTRFAYPTRGEGQLQLPAIKLLNLRIGRSFPFGARGRIEPSLDLVNLANAAADQRWMGGANQQYSPNYGVGSFRVLPRTAQFSIRYAF